MLLIEYPSIEEEGIPDSTKQDTWNLFHTYMDVHIQRLIEDYLGGVVDSITRFLSKC